MLHSNYTTFRLEKEKLNMSFQYLKLIQRKLISKVNRRALSEGFSLINIKYKSYVPWKNLVLISRKLNFIFALYLKAVFLYQNLLSNIWSNLNFNRKLSSWKLLKFSVTSCVSFIWASCNIQGNKLCFST